MDSTQTALDADWLGACRRAVTGLEAVLAQAPSTAERVVETGTRGSGGDRTLVIDSSAEAVVLAELDAIHAEGFEFMALSEERGEVDYGDRGVRVIIDPIDGSLNAKRDACHYALSVAVADGETMADVACGFVHDFGAREQWWAIRGQGAWRDGELLDPSLGERRTRDDRLELVGIESADPRWVQASMDGLLDATHRLRALGAIAITLCQVAAARYDGMVTLRRCRGVDAAAGQLIVREAGGVVSFPGADGRLGAPLDATASAHLAAARTERALQSLEQIPQPRQTVAQ
jgi:myo-inositol-1(or 4)-monophosphatase